MRRAQRLLPISLILILLAISAAPAKDPTLPVPSKMTVGEFALRVVRMAEDDPAVRQSITADQAIARLRAAGLKLKGSANDPLTEGDRSTFALSVAGGLMERVTVLPEGFDTCAALPTVPECHACCLSLPGTQNRDCGRACGQAHANQAKPSASEPTP
jgi:hypothetical protein